MAMRSSLCAVESSCPTKARQAHKAITFPPRENNSKTLKNSPKFGGNSRLNAIRDKVYYLTARAGLSTLDLQRLPVSACAHLHGRTSACRSRRSRAPSPAPVPGRTSTGPSRHRVQRPPAQLSSPDSAREPAHSPASPGPDPAENQGLTWGSRSQAQRRVARGQVMLVVCLSHAPRPRGGCLGGAAVALGLVRVPGPRGGYRAGGTRAGRRSQRPEGRGPRGAGG